MDSVRNEVDPPPEPLVLDYAPPPKPSFFGRIAQRISIDIALGVAIVLASPFVPLPQGIWFFGRRPRILAIDNYYLAFGPATSTFEFGHGGAIFLKILLSGLATYSLHRLVRWMVRQMGTRTHRPMLG